MLLHQKVFNRGVVQNITIVDIDEKGDFVVEGITDEEFEEFLNEVKRQREAIQFVKSGEYLGIYTDKEIISAVPDEENQQGGEKRKGIDNDCIQDDHCGFARCEFYQPTDRSPPTTRYERGAGSFQGDAATQSLPT